MPASATGLRIPGRRRVLATGAAVLGTAATGRLAQPALAAQTRSRLPKGLFSLGVASGDPTPGSVVLWTRLAPDPLRGGGMPGRTVEVHWQVAEDPAFAQVVRRGTAHAQPRLGHSVHVDAAGLRPHRDYWYRFRVEGQLSPVGRTRTAPAPGRAGRLRLALASCQNWQQGYFTPYQDIARQDVDVVLFVGDYIYESRPSAGALRRHEGSDEPYTLAEYRNRYAQYRTDPDLTDMHAAAPWVVTFDDHEVDNDFAGQIPQDPDWQPQQAFIARLTAAYQAFYEHMPVRASAVPNGPHIRMHRSFDYGALARLHVLDTRQYRTDQATSPAGVHDPSRTVLGDRQRAWLLTGLRRSPARWNLIGSQITMAETDLRPGPGKRWRYDAWDGYQAERNALLSELAGVRNPVVLSGDRHLTMVSELKQDFADPSSPVVGAEFVGTSISSGGDPDLAAFHAEWDPRRPDNPHWKLVDAHRGYHLFDITPERIEARVRVVDTVLQPEASARTLARLEVQDRTPGVRLC